MHPIGIGNAIAVAATLLAIAGVLIAIIVANHRSRQAKLEFLRTALERGAPLDPDLLERIMHPTKPAARREPLPRGQGALVAGIIVIAFGVGFAILACFIGVDSPDARLPMLGVACLYICIGIGLLVVSRVLRSKGSVTAPRE